MFLALGILLCTAAPVVVHCILHAPRLAVYLFPARGRRQAHFLELLMIALFAAGLLCLVTAWGLKRKRGWARWTGLCASALLLPGFPVLTVPGAIGLYSLGVKGLPAEPEGAPEYFWESLRRDSLPPWIPFIATLPLAFVGAILLGHVLELPLPGNAPNAVAVVFSPLALWVVRESGHRLVDWGARLGSAPESEQRERLVQMGVAFAGPFASFAAGLAPLVALFKIRGTEEEDAWPLLAFYAVLFMADFARNLVPIGYTDGTKILHLIRWSRRGQELVVKLLLSRALAEAQARSARGDIEAELCERQRVVELILREGATDALDLGSAYQWLGMAQYHTMRWWEAELSLRKSLDWFGKCPGGSARLLEVHSWDYIECLYSQQQRAVDARRAYESGLEAIERARGEPSPSPMILSMYAADLHAAACNFNLASEEVAKALALRPLPNQKAVLLELRAKCEFHLSHAAAALIAMEEAEEAIRLALAQGGWAEPLVRLGWLGHTLWDAGRSGRAVAPLEKAAGMMEKRGAASQALWLRLELSSIFRRAGRFAEAEAALPKEELVAGRLRGGLIHARAEIRLRSGRVDEAIADFEERLRLAKEDPHALDTEVATAQAVLASAFRAAGRLEEAEALARESLEVLKAAEHPDAACSLETLALIGWQRQEDSAKTLLGEAVQVILSAPLLGPAPKARWLEDAARDLDRAGRTQEAQELRSLAAEQWRSLGLETGAEEGLVSPSRPTGSG